MFGLNTLQSFPTVGTVEPLFNPSVPSPVHCAVFKHSDVLDSMHCNEWVHSKFKTALSCAVAGIESPAMLKG